MISCPNCKSFLLLNHQRKYLCHFCNIYAKKRVRDIFYKSTSDFEAIWNVSRNTTRIIASKDNFDRIFEKILLLAYIEKLMILK